LRIAKNSNASIPEISEPFTHQFCGRALAVHLELLVFNQLTNLAASFNETLVAGLLDPRESMVICSDWEALNFVIISSLTSNLPIP